MTVTIVAAARVVEALQIHHAVCRYRRAGLVCSTCTELSERAERALRAVAQLRAADDDSGAPPSSARPPQVAA